mgnify:CR=1 FL=1
MRARLEPDAGPFPVGAVVKGGPGHAIFFDGQGVGFAGMGMGSIILTVTTPAGGTIDEPVDGQVGEGAQAAAQPVEADVEVLVAPLDQPEERPCPGKEP